MERERKALNWVALKREQTVYSGVSTLCEPISIYSPKIKRNF